MKPELKKLLVLNLPYLLFVYLFAKCGQAYRLAAGADASAKLLHLTGGISVAFASPLPSLHLFDLCVGVVGAVAVRLIVYSKGKNAKKYRKGEEYGSARWGTDKDIAPYIDPKFENNILLTQTERLTMTGRPKDPKTARNKNVLVIGGSGSGKTRFYVKPNLMQCFPTSDYPTSFVVTDPKGTLVLETGQMFQRAGYRVKILNTINFSKSMKYNPFVYIHSEKDVLKLVNTLIANTKGEGEKSAEDFWVKSERLFYTALIGYIWYEAPAEEMNFTTLLEMINAVEPERSTLELAGNFHITDDDLGVGGPKQKFARNIEAIRTLFKLEEEHRGATAEEQQVLSQYVGWGGLADAFDPDKSSWAKEYAELKGLLSEEEYKAARGSVLNAHYTSPTVIRAIYDAVERMGFRTGNILEPSMGVGNFFGMLPESMADSRLYGVELDSITGRIAQKLYPEANIKVAGFETTDRRDFYDLAVGNVPFGNYKVNDKAYNKLNFSIHNYFFAKAIDQVRPGGVVAFVTSRYTLDSKDSSARKHMAERADLLGAIRLPNNAFKANAGTDVVSDIIFLQKRDRPADIEPAWVQLGKTADGIAINSYFADHPEMVLGNLELESTQYGHDLTVVPIEGTSLADQLAEAVQHIEGNYTAVEIAAPDVADAEAQRKTLPADPTVKNFSYTVVDGEIYYRENSIMTQIELSDNAKGRVAGMVELRQIVNELIDQQLNDFPDEDIKASQAKLNAAYDAFTAKYGLINDKKNARLFDDDSSYYLLCSLENLDENKNLKSKADMFTKRTIRPERVVTSVDTPSEALAVSIGEHGKVDLPYMAELLGTPGNYERITTELSGVIFKDPVADVQAAQIQYVNSVIMGMAQYLQTSICSRAYHAIDRRVNNAALAVWKKLYPKRYNSMQVSLKVLCNLPDRHKGYDSKTFAVWVEGKWFGITYAFITHSHYEPKPFDQKMTPYTVEGRRRYVNYRAKHKSLPCDRPSVNSPNDIAMSAYAKGRMNFEYYMNREYAYSRDKGKCKCCGNAFSPMLQKHCHHVKNKLPLDRINKVPNLVWLCEPCHRMVHNSPIPPELDAKTVGKIMKYREKLKL